MKIVVVSSLEQAVDRAKEVLYERVDKKTVLFLSGGKTPKLLYETLAKEKVLKPAAVGMVDERFGAPFHETSNEKMIKETGFLDYLDSIQVPFYPILQDPDVILGNPAQRDDSRIKENLDSGQARMTDDLRKKTAEAYDQITRDLFFKFPRSIAIMGIGTDGHISSLAPNRPDFTNPMFEEGNHHQFVGEFNDPNSSYKERVGMTFAGLALIDYFIALVIGNDKKIPLQKSLEPGSLEEIPARFFQQEVSERTLTITDQKV